jgi:drug/metabolite transporter (DMT)-like permease
MNTGRWRTLAALGTVYLAWGGTYPAIRVMVRTAPPLLSTGARFLAAAALLSGCLVLTGGRGRFAVGRRSALGAAAIGTVILGDIGLLALAEQEVEAGIAALIIASVPLWIVLLRVLARDRPGSSTLAGVGLGFGGVAVLILPAGGAAGPLGWLVVLLAAAVVEAGGQIASQRTRLPADLLVSTTLQLLAAGAVLALAGVAAGELGDVRAARVSTDALVAFAYLVIPGSLLAYGAFAWLLAHQPISVVATYAYVNPVVALLAGRIVLGEQITPTAMIATAAIVAGVALVVRDTRRPDAAQPPRRGGGGGPVASDRRPVSG